MTVVEAGMGCGDHGQSANEGPDCVSVAKIKYINK